MKPCLALVVAATAVGLAGCDGQPRADAPETEPARTATPASIIRPEVIAEQAVEPPLAPLEATIPFGEGGHELSVAAEDALADVLASDQLAEGWPIVLRGHTDSIGHDEANLRASRRRAEAVADWLVENGVSEERIEIVALGEQRPVAPNARPDGSPDEEGRAKNRRVTVSIAPAEPEPAAEPPAEPAAAAEG